MPVWKLKGCPRCVAISSLREIAFSIALRMLPCRAFQTKGKAPEGKSWIQTSGLVNSGYNYNMISNRV